MTCLWIFLAGFGAGIVLTIGLVLFVMWTLLSPSARTRWVRKGMYDPS